MALALKDKIAALQAQLKQAKALSAKQSAKDRSAQIKQDRLLDTRRKLCIGTFMLEGGDPLMLVNGKGQTLDQWLTRAEDRALFILGQLPVKVSQSTQDADVTIQEV